MSDGAVVAAPRGGGLLAQVLTTGGARAYALAISVLQLTVTARVLGPEGRGTVAALLAWVTLAAAVLSLSLGQVVATRARGRPPREWAPEGLGLLAAATGVTSLLVWLAVALGTLTGIWVPVAGAPVGALFAAAVAYPLSLWDSYSANVLPALGALGPYNRAQVVGRTVGVGATVVAVGVLHGGVAAALWSLALGLFVSGAMSWSAARRAAGAPLARPSAIAGDAFVDGLKLQANVVGTVLFANADILLVQQYAGAAATGHYQLSAQLVTLLSIIPQAAFPVLLGHVAQGGVDAAWERSRRVVGVVLVLVALAAVVGSALAPLAVGVLGGPRFGPTAVLFRWHAFAAVGQALSPLMAAQWLGRGYFLRSSAITVALGLAAFAANLYAVPRHGAVGAVAVALLVSAVSFLVNAVFALHVQRVSRLDAHPPRQ